MTYSITKTTTFTITHARYLASKVAADMHLCALYYREPAESTIRLYAEELAQYLNAGYIDEYEFGFKKADKRVVSWRYRVDTNGVLTTDDRAGKIVPYVDITGACFFNFLKQNSKFFSLPSDEQNAFKAGLSVSRVVAQQPTDGSGYWVSDRNYSSGGYGLGRQSFQPRS